MESDGTPEDQIGEAVLIEVVRGEVEEVTEQQHTAPVLLPKPRSLKNMQDQKLVHELGQTIRIIGDKLDQNTEFNAMIDGLGRVADKKSFSKLVQEVFRDDQINWGRIVVLFYSVGKLAAMVPISVSPLICTLCFALTMDFFRRKLLDWIRNVGGWITCISEVTQFSLEHLSMSSFNSICRFSGIIGIFITGVLVGTFITWRLNKNS
ncbi:apoptosis regulator BAX-like [Chanos chanos]|uniref:Apoptosis regulator BAX-like n=1 Tax=Chanos chanos TaxID=29144 RepID=A0A6J2WZW8_CHACN|nr:apoptosis regulator BAX-like [Chanos chanos]